MHSNNDTSFLLPHLVSCRAQDDPQGIFARVPAGPAYSSGFKDVTYAQLNNAVNFTASLLSNKYGASHNFETLAYIGAMDMRYSVMMIAGMKLGYKVFLPSPRNSVPAHVTLFTSLQCTKLVVAEPQAPCVPSILKKLKLDTFSLPSLEDLLNIGDVDDIPFLKSFVEAKNDPIFVLHTSGSTGTPKPLIYTHDWVSKCIGSTCLPTLKGHVDCGRYITTGVFFITLPPFHIAGVGMALLIALYHGLVPVYPIPGPPPSTESLVDAISNTELDWACVSPVVVDELGKRPDLLNLAAARLKYICYAGGSVPKASGDAVAQRLTIWTILGSSEAGLTPLVHNIDEYSNADDWVYMEFNPALRHEMRRLHDDLHELVFVRNSETENFQPVFTHFPDAREFSSRDLFKPHPLKEGLWLYHSRIDDVIVFLNGEKTNPISYEHQISGHPEVKAALVVGAQRDEAALLIELVTDAKLTDSERAALISRFWPLVEKANQVTPAHARIAKDKILFVDPQKPMARAGKGTVQRAATTALYAAEIDKVYQQDEALKETELETGPGLDLRTMVRNAVAETVSIDDLDFFQLGMDSLGALRLQRALNKWFPGLHISNDTVYSNSSVNALVRVLERQTAGPKEATSNTMNPSVALEIDATTSDVVADDTAKTQPTTSMDDLARMLETFAEQITAICPRKDYVKPNAQSEGVIILFTGTTGAIGSYVLDVLLRKSSVAHVYCLNRSADARNRQLNNNQARGLNMIFPSERVTFLNGDLTKPTFGLSAERYHELLERVTHVVHNAWPVNFNISLASFAPSIAGVVNLIRFAAQSRRNSSIQFYSSISSVLNHPETTVPEEIIFDLSAPRAMGYGQSKYIAERLLDQACKTLRITASVTRIGQVAGAARTATGWNRREWLPSLVISSASMGILPTTLMGADTVDWVPIDHLAEVLVQLALAPRHAGNDVLGATVNHVVHPRPVKWTSILPVVKETISDTYPSKQPIREVSFGEWLSAVKAKSLSPVEYAALVQEVPSIKLIDFYEGLQGFNEGGLNLTLSLKETSKISSTLAGLEPLQSRWIAGWVKDWLDTAKRTDSR